MDATLLEIDRKIRSVEAALEKKVQAIPEYAFLRELKALREKHVQHLDELKRLLGDRGSETFSIISTCYEIIGDNGKPLQLDSLLRELEKRGIAISGNNPRNDLASMLSSAKEAVHYIRGEGWWLTDGNSEPRQKEKDLPEKRGPLYVGVEGHPSLRA